jgi:hypothetical protein
VTVEPAAERGQELGERLRELDPRDAVAVEAHPAPHHPRPGPRPVHAELDHPVGHGLEVPVHPDRGPGARDVDNRGDERLRRRLVPGDVVAHDRRLVDRAALGHAPFWTVRQEAHVTVHRQRCCERENWHGQPWR